MRDGKVSATRSTALGLIRVEPSDVQSLGLVFGHYLRGPSNQDERGPSQAASPILPVVPERLPLPGPSFLKERELRIGERAYRLGMARPTDGPDGWWLAILWVADDEAVIPFRDVAPAGGPPPDPPLARLGPAVSGALSGMILEDAGRLQMRLATVVPADDPTRPWRVPLAVRAAFRFEPARAATMGANELAETVQAAFARAIEGLHRP
jgi:hypothetical protein